MFWCCLRKNVFKFNSKQKLLLVFFCTPDRFVKASVKFELNCTAKRRILLPFVNNWHNGKRAVGNTTRMMNNQAVTANTLLVFHRLESLITMLDAWTLLSQGHIFTGADLAQCWPEVWPFQGRVAICTSHVFKTHDVVRSENDEIFSLLQIDVEQIVWKNQKMFCVLKYFSHTVQFP